MCIPIDRFLHHWVHLGNLPGTCVTVYLWPPRPQLQGEELKARVMPPCVKGEKVACLAITEPTAGSDVANLKCSAKLEGDFYILNPGLADDSFIMLVKQ